MTITHQMTLEYTLAPGWMTPFVEGLQNGQAVARSCAHCSAVSFPPLKICLCGGTEQTWITLVGRADILFRTTGQDGDFALVQFEGSTTKATVRLDGIEETATRGVLTAPFDPLPQLCLGPIKEGHS